MWIARWAPALTLTGLLACAQKSPAAGPVSPVAPPTGGPGDVASEDALASTVASLGHRLAETEDKLFYALAELQRQQGELDTLAARQAEVARPAARAPRPARPDPAAVFRVDLGEAHARGPATALVTLVQWSDYQCPYCKRAEATLKTLRDKYGDDLRVVMKHNPLSFHDRALAAALAAEAAGRQGKFWKMHDKLFKNAKDLSDANIAKWARGMGLDMRRFKKDLKSKVVTDAVAQMQAQGLKLGARGTPAFFINGRFLSGAQPVDAFAQIIDEELVKAKARVASGTRRRDVYRVTVADGRTQP